MNARAATVPLGEIRKLGALMRAKFLVASSYRLRLALSVAATATALVPLFFVAEALQPIVADSIRDEGERYFGFLLLGMAAFGFVTFALRSVEGPISSGIQTGTLEALLSTPTSLPVLLAGLSAYDLTRTSLRALALLAVALAAGTAVSWAAIPVALVLMGLITLAYMGIGLVAAALHLVFRTSGPLLTGAMTLSALLGGVYYSTTVVPPVIQPLAHVVPLTYGLRALRQTLLQAAPLHEVAGDLAVLALLTLVLFGSGTLALRAGLQHARRAGTLSQY